MFDLEVKTSYPFKLSQKNALAQRLESLLKEIISQKYSFEDPADFLLWAEESLPLIHWHKDPSEDGEISVYLLFWSSPDPYSEFFFSALKRKLAPSSESFRVSLQHFDFILSGILHKKLSLAEVRIYPEETSETHRILNLLPSLVEELMLEINGSLYGHHFSHQSKLILVQERIAKFKRRFYSRINEQIFEEARGFLALTDHKFIEQRPYYLLSRLIISQYFFRKTLLKGVTNSPHSRHIVCRILPSCLSSPFTSKSVIGIFVGVNFLHKYDIFTEEHIIRALQRLHLDVQCVPGSCYSFQRHGESFKFLYMEIEKKNEKSFSLVESRQLRSDLKEILKNSVERLQPSVFMVNNEEEIIKNVLLLNREIQSTLDLPQIMIQFEGQTDKDVCFQIILVYAGKNDLFLSLKRCFNQSEIIYLPHWAQIVRYLKRKQPVQAHVFKLRITKTPDLIRSDASLNFYAARHRISEYLEQAIGEFRDYNGGIILKQGEVLAQFKQLFKKFPPEMLENFFYRLAPLEVQTTIPLSNLSLFFELFLEGKNLNFVQPQDCFVKFSQQGCQTYCMLQAKDSSFIDSIKASVDELVIDPKNLISIQLVAEDRVSLGYIYETEIDAKHTELVDAIQQGIEIWKKKLANVKTLRLAISSGLRPLDPRIQGNEDTKFILKMLFEGLMRINSQGKVEFGVADKVKISPTRKKYTFKLRRTYWSNGKPLLADDFVYAWRTVLSPHFKTPSAYLFYPIKNARDVKEGRLSPESLGLKALTSNILEVELAYPIPYFLELIAQPQFAPINSTIDRSQPTWPHQEDEGYVCNGAFLLKKNHPTQGYELIKNPSYLDHSKIFLENVSIKNAQSNEMREMFLRDEIDWLGFPTGTIDIPSLPLEQGEILVLPNDSLYWYVFNTRCFPFNHNKIRRAFAYAVDRTRILQSIPPGHWPAFTVLPFQHSRGSLMEESREKGRALFEEALNELGLDRKSFPILKLFHVNGKVRDSVAKIIKEEWENTFGVRCQIEDRGWNEIFSRLSDGNFQICGINWVSLINDPSYTLHSFQSTSRFINFSHWSNQEYDQILDQSNQEKRLSKRFDYYSLAEEVLLREAPVIPLIRTLPCSIKKSRVEMFSHSSLKSWDFKWASIRNMRS